MAQATSLYLCAGSVVGDMGSLVEARGFSSCAARA